MGLGRQKTDRSPLSLAFDQVQNTRLITWTFAATLSILTSRYLLVELNAHYPIHLHLLQLATAGAITTATYSRQTFAQSSPSIGKEKWQQWLPLAIVAALMATATTFSVQAVLHSQNLPTLTMLAVISPGIEACILVARTQISHVRWQIVQIALIAIGCVGILLGEYRLLVPVLESAIPAVLIAGVARAYYSTTIQNTGITHTSQQLRLLFCGTGFLITGLWALTRQDESWGLFFHAMRFRDVPLLIINCLATAVAMLLGQSILLPLGDPSSANDEPRNDTVGEMLSLLAMTGTIGLWSTLVLRRSYTSWTQFCFFFVAVGVIASRSRLNSNRDRRKIYSVVPSGPTSHYVDSEDNDIVDLAGSNSRNGQKSFFRRINGLAISIVVPAIWIAFMVLNFSDRVHQTLTPAKPILDLEYAPATGTEMVISMYKERVDEVARLISTIKAMPALREASVHIYVKDNGTDLDWIRMGTGANNVTLIPNIGREGETYLYHILHNWNSLAKHTLFLQADVHNPREFYPRIRDYFDPVRTGMLNLGWSGAVCNCNSCGDRYGFEDTTHLLPDLHSRISNDTACDKVLLSYKGQFVASAKRIRGIDKAIYADIREAFVNPNSWAHQEEYLQGRKDSMSAPVFGYTVERIWNLLLQCNDMEVAWKCASLCRKFIKDKTDGISRDKYVWPDKGKDKAYANYASPSTKDVPEDQADDSAPMFATFRGMNIDCKG
ncbi:hypothetical protein DM02DRAFT_673924 [Periconia macrospinosa]|uniref:Uncharacterized protein n=1 Tax=Periconia macrospinosa TaxID=97972 RepID=A0A2V1DHQ1_9PLEO|nr:hypothetical protein DM02DRAFT_673924 [Periconia macrospinosa]